MTSRRRSHCGVLVALFVVGPGALSIQAQPAVRAAAAYAAGDFAAAEALYRQALAAPDAAVGPLLFALGNCAYRQDRLADAVLAYRRALLRLPRDPELLFNARWTERRLGAERLTPSLLTTLLTPLSHVTPGELLIGAGVLQTVGLVGALLVRRHRRARLAWLVGAVFGALMGGCGLYLLWLAPTEGVVLAPRSAIRAAPSTDAAIVGQVQAGDTVEMHERGETFVRVSHAVGSGWIEQAQVGVID